MLHRRNLRRTATIALCVGAVLFCINQLDTVLRQGAGAGTALKAGLNLLVPLLRVEPRPADRNASPAAMSICGTRAS